MADETVIARLADGRQVLLYENGTWQWHAPAQVTQAQEAPFRQAWWGMSMAQVKAVESARLLDESAEALLYEGTVAGLGCTIFYVFLADQLVSGTYNATVPHANDNAYLDDFQMLKESLTAKYGRPAIDTPYWKNDLYMNDPASWGMAVGAGHLILHVEWRSQPTTISLALTGDNYVHRLDVSYSSNQHAALVEAHSRRSHLADL